MRITIENLQIIFIRRRDQFDLSGKWSLGVVLLNPNDNNLSNTIIINLNIMHDNFYQLYQFLNERRKLNMICVNISNIYSNYVSVIILSVKL